MPSIGGDTAPGAALDVSNTVAVATLINGARGSLLNAGDETIYLKWNADAVDADEVAAINKAWLATGSACSIPRNVDRFAYRCATAKTSQLLFVEDK